MKFREHYDVNEKWTRNDFAKRDFGDATPTIVPLPKIINPEDVEHIETYVHNAETVQSFVFDHNGNIAHFVWGTLENPAEGIESARDEKHSYMFKTQHPTTPSAWGDYSGVAPIDPPFKDYNGPIVVPKEFNTKGKTEPYGSFKGVREPEGWTLN